MKFTGNFSYKIDGEIKMYDADKIKSGDIVQITEPKFDEDTIEYTQVHTLETDEGTVEYTTTYAMSVNGNTSDTELTKCPDCINPENTFKIIEEEYDDEDE